jgi:hypothetical protein
VLAGVVVDAEQDGLMGAFQQVGHAHVNALVFGRVTYEMMGSSVAATGVEGSEA